jgi:hypothetical protein
VLQRSELWRDVARPVEQISFGGTLRERETLQNLIDDAVQGANPWGRDRVMPWDPSDYVGGVGSYPIEGDRLRPPLFVKGAGDLDEVSINDIDQNALGDCYFMAALASVAKQDPQRIRDMVVDNGDGTYTVKFKDRSVTVNADFPGGVNGDGHAAGADGTPQKTKEIWPLVFEKAFGVYLDAVDPYGRLAEADTPMVALEALTGRPVEFSSSANKSLDELYADLQAGKSIVWFSGDVYPAKHFFAVEDVFRDPEGKEWVQLYNPWGSHDWVPLDFVQGHQMYTA